MSTLMRILFIVIFLAFVKESMAQESTRYYFPEIGWTIHLPLDFKVLNTEQESASIKRGKKGIAQALDTNVNLLETINLISAKKSRNYFNASLTANNSKSDAAAANFINSQEKAIYEAMSKSAKVDSSSTVLNVGGEPFRKFEMIVHLNEQASFGMNLVTKLRNGYYFVITYAYLDSNTQKQIESMLSDSKFSK